MMWSEPGSFLKRVRTDGNSKCQACEAGVCVACVSCSKEAGLAGPGQMRAVVVVMRFEVSYRFEILFLV